MDAQTALIERVRQRMAADDVELPVFDGAAIELHRDAQRNRLDAQDICQLLERDATLVSEVLRMANSSFFGGLQEVRTLRSACVRLGVRQIAAIVFSVSQKRLYSASSGPFRARLQRLWEHASTVSMAARWLAIRSGRASLSDEAFIAGLLHDIGKLCALRQIEQIALDAAGSDDPAARAACIDGSIERALLELNREQGVHLLKLWKIPPSYTDIVYRMPDAPRGDDSPVLVMVRLADSASAFIDASKASGAGASDSLAPDILESDVCRSAAEALGLDEAALAQLQLLACGMGASPSHAQRAA